MKSKLIVLLVIMLAFVMIFTESAFASSVDEISYLMSDESSSSDESSVSSSSSTTLSDITSSLSNSLSTSSISSSSTSSSQTKLPQTGENDFVIFALIVVFTVIAIYAYKKVNDFRNI